eukprot:m.172735 g.172735  ORF g.172735 m.172735 type:complete len:215 (-) comp25223_c0_seq6:92-736(-)
MGAIFQPKEAISHKTAASSLPNTAPTPASSQQSVKTKISRPPLENPFSTEEKQPVPPMNPRQSMALEPNLYDKEEETYTDHNETKTSSDVLSPLNETIENSQPKTNFFETPPATPLSVTVHAPQATQLEDAMMFPETVEVTDFEGHKVGLDEEGVSDMPDKRELPARSIRNQTEGLETTLHKMSQDVRQPFPLLLRCVTGEEIVVFETASRRDC